MTQGVLGLRLPRNDQTLAVKNERGGRNEAGELSYEKGRRKWNGGRPYESWYEVICKVPARFSLEVALDEEDEGGLAPYFALIAAACFLNVSTLRLYDCPLRRLIGTLMGAIGAA